MALVQRVIKASFVLGEGSFGGSGQNQLDLPPLRTMCDVIYAGGNAMGTLEMSIFGMSKSQVNQLSTLGMIFTQKRRNAITVSAGDAGGSMATVFQGTITNAWLDGQAQPDVPFRVEAHTGLVNALAPATVTSVKGTADAATLLSGLAVQMGLRFENNGVSVKLSNPYYSGSARTQALQIVRDAGIEWNAGANGVLAIWNPGQGRGGSSIMLSRSTGLDGYPTFTSNGIMVRSIFNPSIGLGSTLTVQSDLTPANGSWVAYGLNHHLDAQVPRGRWFSDIQAAPPGAGPFTP